MTTKEPKYRTITLTSQRPIRIDEANWPVLASARDDSYSGNDGGRHDEALRQGELDEYHLTVREHYEDRRVIVYARLSGATPWTGTKDRAEGEILMASEIDPELRAVARAIQSVGERCGLPGSVIRDCIADLPALDLDESEAAS